MSRKPSGAGEDEPIMLTVPQAAKLLQVSENHLRNLIAQNLIPHVRYGKLIRVPRWGLLQSIAAASGTPVQANFKVALVAEESVHGHQPNDEEGS